MRQVLEWIDVVEESGSRCQSVAGTHDAGTDQTSSARCLDVSRAHLATAGDLVATHQQIGGALAEPPPTGISDLGLGTQLSSVLRLTLTIAPNEPLALRCRQAGLTRADVDRALPLPGTLEDATWDLARSLRFPATGLAALGIAGAEIDCRDPGTEWQQRMARIDRRLYRHELAGRVSIQTLRDVAYLGLVTSHVLTTSGIRSTPDVTCATEQYKQLVDHLAPLLSTEPRDEVITRDIQRMLDLAHPATTADDLVARGSLLRSIDASVPVLDGCGERAGRLLAHTSDAWLPAKQHARYLQNPFPSGKAAQRAPASPVGWPRLDPTATGLGLT